VGIASTEFLYSFLPSKPGVGTTTLALNSAVALAKKKNMKVLLVDFDLNCGLVQFMLKLDNPNSVMEAAERSHELDENLWPQLVTTIDNLDILHAGRLDPQRRIEPLQLRNLLEFARRNYQVICADLSGNLERFSLDIMQESKAIFLVCTPEVPSLHLAKEKALFLDNMNLGDRVRVLLNRSHKRMLMTAAEIEELLGREVHTVFPNEYANVHRAVTQGQPVQADSSFGKQCNEFANTMLNKKHGSSDAKRRFVQYFALAPAKYEFGS
jgi:pilus assembly protein CpaE